jgi:hypothetical protein
MCVTEDINIFACIYHNKKNISISCVVYNNVKHTGISDYKYDDRRSDNIVNYKGQKHGRFDNCIVGGSTLYLEKDNEQEYKYIGLVTSVNCIDKTYISGKPNEYELILDFDYIHNGYKFGDKLEYVNEIPRGRGSGCFKKSSLWRLGLDYSGNMMSGIIKTSPLFK